MPPVRRLGAFFLVGFAVFITTSTAAVLFYNLFGERSFGGQGIAVPSHVFYATGIFALALALAGYSVWLARSLRSYEAFSAMLRRGGLDPRRPTANGLRVYSDEQLLALRSRYEREIRTEVKEQLGCIFGFRKDDGFAIAPLSARPGTFEINALRVEWESNLILRSEEPLPEISWWLECRRGFLPRRADEVRRLIYALRYTGDSVRELKRRYGYRTDRWHTTVPEGKLFDALRDYDDARRIRVTLQRATRE